MMLLPVLCTDLGSRKRPSKDLALDFSWQKEKASNSIASIKVEHKQMNFKRPIAYTIMALFLALNLTAPCYAKDKAQTSEEKKQYEQMVTARDQILTNMDHMFARYDKEQRTGKSEPYQDEEQEQAYQIIKKQLTALSRAFETMEKETSKGSGKSETTNEEKKP